MVDLNKYVGTPYFPGRDDCYGLARKYYRQEHGLILRNYARPEDFAYLMKDEETGIMSSVMDLFGPNFMSEGFIAHNGNWRQLAVGDALLMTLGDSTVCNHCAIYVGNNLILHHLYGKISEAEALTDLLKSATVQKLRHPEVFKTQPPMPSVDFMELLNPNVRRRLQRATQAMESRS